MKSRVDGPMNFVQVEVSQARRIPLHEDKALHPIISDRIESLLAHAMIRWGLRMPAPTVDFRLRGGLAGKAHLQRHHLQFNAALLRANYEHFLHQTVGHEVAHLVAYRLYGARTKPHGAEWKNVMREFGLTTRATHDYDVSTVRRSRSPFIYACGCNTDIRVGALRHKRASRGAAYVCRRCAQRIVFLRTHA